MSSFICNKKTYQDIYTGLHVFYNRQYSNSQKAIEDLFNEVSVSGYDCNPYTTAVSVLYSLNVDAVNQRYGEKTDTLLDVKELEKICELEPKLSPIQFVKSLECLHYQMSEVNIPEKSKLYAHVENLISAICKDYVHNTKQYNTAVWG